MDPGGNMFQFEEGEITEEPCLSCQFLPNNDQQLHQAIYKAAVDHGFMPVVNNPSEIVGIICGLCPIK